MTIVFSYCFKAKVLKLWLFNSDLQYKASEDFKTTSSASDMIFWRNDIIFIYSNEPSLRIVDTSQKSLKILFLRYYKDKKSVKVTEFNDLFYHFESQLNGHRITAATDRRINNKTFVYLFAGRMLCRQELSEKFVEVCNIEDIADWIDCTEGTTDTKDTKDTSDILDDIETVLIILGLLVIFIVMLIIAIIFTLCLIFSNVRNRSESGVKVIGERN